MKKHIALLFALIIAACTLAACAASVPSSPSLNMPSSSSVASAPSSSVAVSSLPQSSSVSALPTLPMPEADTYTLLSQDDNTTTYQYNVGIRYNSPEVYSFSITLPSNWYFDDTSTRHVYSDIQDNEVIEIGGISEYLTPDELIAQSPPEDWELYSTLLDSGSYTCEDGKLVSYLYVESIYNAHLYIYDYSIMVEENMALRLVFYREEDTPDVDFPIQNAIIESIETIAV